MTKQKLTTKKLTKKQKENLKIELQFKVTSMMVDLIMEHEAVRIFWQLVKTKEDLKNAK